MEYSVLGQLSASAGGTRVKLGGKRQRLVLAVLLANANRVVSQDALLDAVWNEDLPEGGPRTLHTYISILRKTLGEAVDRDGSGYILEVAPDQLDSSQFEGLVAEARGVIESDPSSANELLRRGLSLWRGTAYGDLGHHLALVPEVARLTDERAAALEARFELDLLLGRHEQVVPEVEAVLHEHPYRENVAAILMLALYRSGRQAEALRTYRRMRERLVDELGIEPCPRLQDLELRILEADPSLAAPAFHGGMQGRSVTPGARGYELHEQIGATRAGERFRGFQSTLGREVSVMVVDDKIGNSQRFIQRFESEMQMVSRFEHPHLAPIFDYWRDPHQACVVGPFYRGGSLESAMEGGELSVASVVRLCDQLAGAVGFIHRQGYAHGAIDAASVLLDDDMNAFLCDTGLAGMFAPESDHGRAEDIRQLGDVVFRALTFHRPNSDPSISTWRPDLPEDLDHAVARALHPNPELRYQHVEDFARALRQSVGLDVMAPPGDSLREQDSNGARRNPYKGLRAFHEVDAADFHGRDVLVHEMMEAILTTRLLALVGASGSGKSSAVRAGLLPKLRRGELPESDHWVITDMFPGTHPFESLEAALLRVAAIRPPQLYERLTSDASGLTSVVEEVLASDQPGLLLLIDQFEELFSLTSSRSERQLFLDAMATAVREVGSRLRVIVTLRADFFDQPLQHPEFADVLRSSVVTVSPPTRDGLARAISEPARRVGVSLEPGLVSRIVDDVREQPGGLPLLQFALTELFSQREGDLLTQAAYQGLGGVGGTLARRAEETYLSLPSDAREATRQLFLRLVTVDELADDTRRRVRQSELLDIEVDRTVMNTVIQRFGALRFLSFDRDSGSRAPTVELAHEAILREWHRLRTWVDERREDLLIHRRIQMTVQDWRNSGEDTSYLLLGNRLEQATAWIERTDIAVSEEERRLIERSIAFDESERAGRKALEEKAARRRRAAIWIFAGAAVVASVLGIYAVGQRGDALQSASEATARELTQAAVAITEDDPELGVLLAAEAIEAARQAGSDPRPESFGALWSAHVANRVTLTLPGVGTMAVAFSPRGSEMAVDSALGGDGLVTVRDATTGEEVGRLPSSQADAINPVTEIAYSPDGDWIVVIRSPLELGGAATVEVFDATSRQLVHRLAEGAEEYVGITFTDPSLFAVRENSSTTDGDSAVRTDIKVRVLATGEEVAHRVLSEANELYVSSSQFIPGTMEIVVGRLATPGREASITALDVSTGATSWEIVPEFDPQFVVLSPSGERLAVANPDLGLVVVYDISSLQPLFGATRHPNPLALNWRHDSEMIAVSGNESDITLVDATTGQTDLVLSGHTAGVFSTSFHPDGHSIASVSHSGEVRVWDIEPGGPAEGTVVVATQNDVIEIDVTDQHLVVALADDFVDPIGTYVFDRDTSVRLAVHPFLASNPVRPMVATTANLIAGIEADGEVNMARLEAGDTVYDLPSCSWPSAIAPDGRFVVLDATIAESLASCADASNVASGIYDIESEQLVVDYGRRQVSWGAVSDEATFDGTRYAAAVINEAVANRIEIWALGPARLLGTLTPAMADDLVFLLLEFSSDARYLAVGTAGARTLVVDIERLRSGSGVEEATIFNQEVHTGNAAQAHVTNDRRVITAGFDGFYRFWDLDGGNLLFEMEVDGVRFHPTHDLSPDEAYFYYEDGNGVVRRMPTDLDEMIELATDSVTRDLTDDECRRYLHTEGCEG